MRMPAVRPGVPQVGDRKILRTEFARALSFLYVLCLVAVPASADTLVQGTISSGEWTSAMSPVRIVAAVTLPETEHLTISEGVDVLFDVDVPFEVAGRLDVVGTEDDSVRFLPNSDVGNGEWGGIRFENADSAMFAYTRISGGRADGDLWADNAGGGIYAKNTWLSMSNCVLSGNAAQYAGGIAVIGSHASLSRCAIYRNTVSGLGGGLHIGGAANVTLDNCTVADNSIDALYIYGSNVYVRNSILWVTSPDTVAIHSSSVPQPFETRVSHSDVYGGWYSGIGNIDDDPAFVDPVANDYRLSATSPCIDVGDPTKYDGDGTQLDMGAFPYGSASATGFSLALPEIEAFPGDEIEISITASATDISAADLIFTFSQNMLEPVGNDPLTSHAFMGVPGATGSANVRNDSVFVSLFSAEAISLDHEVIATLTFRVKSDATYGATSTLAWVPFPETNLSEQSMALTSGSVRTREPLWGDVSGDDWLTAWDASMILLWKVRAITSIDHLVADVTGNGETTSYDAAYIARKVLDPSVVFPVEGGPTDRVADGERSLSWIRNGAGWTLTIDDPEGVAAGDLRLVVGSSDSFKVTGPQLVSSNVEGSVLHVSFVRQESNRGELMMVEGATTVLESPPDLVAVSLNEGRIPVAQQAAISRFVLHQNSPNPFNPLTTIRYTLRGASDVRLGVYNSVGQLVKTLVDESLPAGEHQVSWDGVNELGRPLASGVYFYRLDATQDGILESDVRRMVLVR